MHENLLTEKYGVPSGATPAVKISAPAIPPFGEIPNPT